MINLAAASFALFTYCINDNIYFKGALAVLTLFNFYLAIELLLRRTIEIIKNTE